VRRIVVVGAGMGGLAAATDMARAGHRVTVLERAATPGGKMREVFVGGRPIDAGPTVFTMRWVFESLFRDAGARLDDALELAPAEVLARHAWRDGGRLDLYADRRRSAQAIAEFSGSADARGYLELCARSAAVYRALDRSFMAAPRPSPARLTAALGARGLLAMARTPPWRTLWAALGGHFRDPRLRQLFARYATYVGSSPLAAPATLMLIAHVEQEGVWRVRGGMRRVADAIAALAEASGARFRYGAGVARIDADGGRVQGVALESGEFVEADAVVFNGDVSALGAGLLGSAPRRVAAAAPAAQRGLSAITWCVNAPTRGFPLEHHNVFFASHYPAEFERIFRDRRITEWPTVYVCAQGPGHADAPDTAPRGERLLVLVNAPADGDRGGVDDATLAGVESRTFALLSQCGLEVDRGAGATIVTRPQDFAQLFPGTGGSLYGRANHGALASFARPGSRTSLHGLYLAGGSAHPGPGIPMATLSGRLAAAAVLEDLR
jgi:1-hydroxycarotenoid 3,4-desaturase